jgi:hypothetical protein
LSLRCQIQTTKAGWIHSQNRTAKLGRRSFQTISNRFQSFKGYI